MSAALNRPLDDIEARIANDDSPKAGMIEFATFTEGEYVESIYVTRRRAAEICADIGRMLGIFDHHFVDAILEEVPDDTPDESEELAPGQRHACDGHVWNMTAGEADENNVSGEGEQMIYCVKCGACGDV